jgi:Periplasmic component of the Tol biopolymer transport system
MADVSLSISRRRPRDVWLLDLGDNALSRLTFENSGHDPTWLPNGKELLFAAEVKGQIGIFKTGIDGSGGAQPVLFEGPQITAHAVTPDGKTAIAVRAQRAHSEELATS